MFSVWLKQTHVMLSMMHLNTIFSEWTLQMKNIHFYFLPYAISTPPQNQQFIYSWLVFTHSVFKKKIITFQKLTKLSAPLYGTAPGCA